MSACSGRERVLGPSVPLAFFKWFAVSRLDAVDPNAYDAFKASRNLGDVIDRVLRNQQEASNGSGPRKLLTVEASLMTPVQPMLVRSFAVHTHTLLPPVCRSVEWLRPTAGSRSPLCL